MSKDPLPSAADPERPMDDLSPLLLAAGHELPPAIGALVEQLYPELRRMARARVRQAGPRLQIDTVALVNETYLRLLKLEQLQVNDRSHFMAYCGRVMRAVVVDLAREQGRERRGGGESPLTLDTLRGEGLPDERAEVLKVHEALLALEAVEPRLARLVELRFFVGLSGVEAAEALGVSARTMARDWEKARAFLHANLRT